MIRTSPPGCDPPLEYDDQVGIRLYRVIGYAVI